MMAEVGREEFLDLDGRPVGAPGPGDSQVAADLPCDGPPVVEQGLVGDQASLAIPGRLLGVEHVAEPEHRPLGDREAIPTLQRGRDLERIAHGDDHMRFRPEPRNQVEPERHEPADPRILHDEQWALGIIAEEHVEDLIAIALGNRRVVPGLRELGHVVPGRADRREHRVVDLHQIQ